ncbi:MAG TPA: phage head closure protein [Bryobacteraceae bacterium]|nr:phage head closure protein [Bryobacteraceae bacterium]
MAHSSVRVQRGWPVIDPGKMRHTLTFLEQSVTAGASGAKETWAPGNPPREARAAVETMASKDRTQADQTGTQLSLSAAIWFQANVKPSMRVQHNNGNVYVVQSVENVLEMDVVLVLNCLGLGANT